MVSTCFNEVGGSRGSRQQLLPGRGALGDDPMGPDEPNFSPYDGLRQFPHRARWKSMEGYTLGSMRTFHDFRGGCFWDHYRHCLNLESHGISWNLHLKGMGARELGSKVSAKTIDAELYSIDLYTNIYIIISKYYIITLYYKWFHMHLVIDSNYLLIPTLSVCWVPLARPSFHRSVHIHPLRNVHYSVL